MRSERVGSYELGHESIAQLYGAERNKLRIAK